MIIDKNENGIVRVPIFGDFLFEFLFTLFKVNLAHFTYLAKLQKKSRTNSQMLKNGIWNGRKTTNCSQKFDFENFFLRNFEWFRIQINKLAWRECVRTRIYVSNIRRLVSPLPLAYENRQKIQSMRLNENVLIEVSGKENWNNNHKQFETLYIKYICLRDSVQIAATEKRFSKFVGFDYVYAVSWVILVVQIDFSNFKCSLFGMRKMQPRISNKFQSREDFTWWTMDKTGEHVNFGQSIQCI